MTSCPHSSDDTVTAHGAIHVARFGERRGQICVLDRPLLVLSILYDMVSPHFFLFAFISVCRDSLVCLLAGPVISGEKRVLEPICV